MKETREIKAGICRKWFTLVELLIVIGVISILAALLLPALAAAKDSAYTAICQSNLKQLGLWAMMYANDWDGVLPHDGFGVDHSNGYTENPDNLSWEARCALYNTFKAKNKCNPVLQCPKARKILTPMEYSYRIDYGLSDYIKYPAYNLPGLPRITTVKPSSIIFGPCCVGGDKGWWAGKVNTGTGCTVDGNWIWRVDTVFYGKGHSSGTGANFYHLDGSVRTWLLNDYKTEAAKLGYWGERTDLLGLRR